MTKEKDRNSIYIYIYIERERERESNYVKEVLGDKYPSLIFKR
jgi:hypothetical protein